MITSTDIEFGNEILTGDEKSSPLLGMSRKDIDQYSLRRVLDAQERCVRLRDGLEFECHSEMAKSRRGLNAVEGFCVPFDIFAPKMRRDMTVGVFSQGGALVQTDVSPDPIPLLRNRICAVRMGVTVLTGLRGNFAIPRQTSAATVQSLGETAAGALSTPTFDQPQLTPKRVTASVSYSKQLLLQSSPSVEDWLRSDLMAQIAIRLDFLLLNGNGAGSEPTGILHTPGVGSVVFGGTTPTWAQILSFENALAAANADVPGAKIGWVTSPSVRNRLKGVAQALAGATTVSAKPIWEGGTYNDGSNDGVMNQYRAAVTNQVLNNQVLFGNWVELVLGIFGNGIDLTYNPYSRAKEAVIELTALIYSDVLCRHPQSFIISADSGAA
jgi:HK97 family phage major capsid protein